MNPFEHKALEEPDGEKYLWRYIKPNRIQSFLDGEIYFSPLGDFDDYHEAITPLHYFVYSFMKRYVGMKFDLSKKINEVDSETAMGNMMMWVALYDIEKKISMVTGITDEKELQKKVYDYCENSKQFILPHNESQRKYYTSCWFVGDLWESAVMWASYSQPGGIAVRIKFSDFKNAILKYFGMAFKETTHGVAQVYAGLIKYKDYNDAEEWLKHINMGTPLPFFKQHHFKEEKEFRVILERKEDFSDEQFERLHKIFENNVPFNIILHPSAVPADVLKMQDKISGNKFLKVKLSDMDSNHRFSVNKNEDTSDLEQDHPF